MAKSAAKVKRDNALVRYFKETRAELKKVSWPNREEAQMLTVVVLGVTIFMAALLGALDFVFDQLLGSILDGNILAIIVAIIGLAAFSVAGSYVMRE